jgi:hypothetical protein
MANFMEHLGLDFLVETEDQVRGLWGYARNYADR